MAIHVDTLAEIQPKAGLRADILSAFRSKDVAALLIISLVLLVAWSFIVPAFEGPDEPLHWQYSRHLHYNWWLPYYDTTFVEANQPPLYYLLVAPFSAITQEPPEAVYRSFNNHLNLLHPPRVYRNSWGDFRKYWSFRIVRLVTCVFSIVTVLFAFLAGLEATGRRSTGLLAGAIVAFLPQFTFRAMNVSNDAMVATTCAIALYLIVRIERRGYDQRTGIAFGVAFAFALLSKINAMLLPVPYAIAVLRGSSWITTVRDVVWTERLRRFWPFAIAGVILAPWMIRNQVLYGDVFAARQMAVAVPELMSFKPITDPYFVTIFPGRLLKSFVGLFGAMNLPLSDELYWLYYTIGIAAGFGLLWSLIRRRFSRRLTLALSSVVALALALVVRLNLTFTQPQGRYLFPALTAIAVLAAVGIEGLPAWRWRATTFLIVLLGFLNVAILFGVVYPAYWDLPTKPAVLQDLVIVDGLRGPVRVFAPGDQLIQEIVPREPGLTRVEVFVGTWSRRFPSGRMKATLKDGKSGETMASSTTPLERVSDVSFVPLDFPAIPDSKDKPYLLELQAEVPAGYQLGLWLTVNDLYPNGRLLENGKPLPRDLIFQTFYAPELTFSPWK